MIPPSPLRLWRAAGPTAREIVRGSSSGLLLSVANRVIGLATGAVLARVLGVEQFGVYSLAIALASMIGVLVEIGLPTLLVREVARSDGSGPVGSRRALIRDAVLLTLFGGCLAGALMLAASAIPELTADDLDRATLLLVAVLLPVISLGRVLTAGLMGLRRIQKAQMIEFIIAPAMMLGIVVGIQRLLGQATAGTALQVYIVATLIGILCAAAWLGDALRAEAPPPRPTPGAMIALARAGRPFLLVNAAVLLSTQVDTLIVGLIGDARDVAFYRVGAQGAVLGTFALQVLQNVGSPFMARFQRDGNAAAVRRLFRTLQGVTLASATALTALFVVAGKPLIALLFGAEYVSAQPILVIISLGYLVNAACGPIGMLLSMTGHERAISRIMWITGVVNVIAGLVLGALAGPLGVAVATACTLASYHLLLRIYARRHFDL
jgi:O-antigen/teichoic acid export membrane protein